MEVVLTRHAREMAARRGIEETLIQKVARRPDQRLVGSEAGLILQSRYIDPQTGKTMLLRLVARETPGTIRILTVYKTSRIEKYWKPEGAKP